MSAIEDRIKELIAARNFGGAWGVAENAYGSMSYVEFLTRFVGKA